MMRAYINLEFIEVEDGGFLLFSKKFVIHKSVFLVI